MQILLFKTVQYWDQGPISSRILALSMASSRCVGEQKDALSGILTQNRQNCNIPAKGFIQIIMPFDLFYSEPCFSPVTPLRLQEAHVGKKSSFIVIQYLPDTAASGSSVRGDLASSVPVPTGRILCNVHFGLSLQFLAVLGILFLVIAYVQGHCFWCVGYLPADMEARCALYSHTAHTVIPGFPGGTASRKASHLFKSGKTQELTLQSLVLVFLYWQFHVLNLHLLHTLNLWILAVPFLRVHWICMSPEKSFWSLSCLKWCTDKIRGKWPH